MLLRTARTGNHGLCLVIATLVAGIHLAPAPNRAQAEDWADFGRSVAVQDDLLVVGADNEARIGALYLFRRNGDRWGILQRLAPSKASHTGFGGSVAIDGKIIVAGQVLANVGGARSVGAAYVFEARGATFPEVETQLLSAPQPRPFSGFGESVAVNGETIAVGAPADIDGAVYLFRKKGNRWISTVRLSGRANSEDRFGATFGQCVAMSDKYLVVGAPMQPLQKQGRAGAVYIYRRADDGSVLDPPQMLTPLPGQGVEELGAAIAIRDTEILVGAYGIDVGSKRDVGGAVLYTAGADGKFPAEPTAVYVAAEAAADERAGMSVALTADYVMVGSSLAAKKQGCVYVFPRNASDKESARRLTPGASSDPPHFGLAMAQSGEQLLVGARAFDKEGRVVPYTLDKSSQWKPGDNLSPNSPPAKRAPPAKRGKKK